MGKIKEVKISELVEHPENFSQCKFCNNPLTFEATSCVNCGAESTVKETIHLDRKWIDFNFLVSEIGNDEDSIEYA